VLPATPTDLKTKRMIVYQIRNRINSKSYIGQTINTFHERYEGSIWWIYRKNGTSRSRHLANAADKYGKENFDIFILESEVPSKQKLNELEIYHINRLNCIYPNGYNYQLGGQNMGNRKHHQETCDKMALAHSNGKVYRLLNNKTGIIHEFVNIQRFANENGLSGPQLTIMLSKRPSKFSNKRYYYKQHKEWSLPDNPIRKILCISPTGDKYIVLDGVDGGIKGFCKRMGFRSTSHVFSCINGNIPHAYHWTFKIL